MSTGIRLHLQKQGHGVDCSRAREARAAPRAEAGAEVKSCWGSNNIDGMLEQEQGGGSRCKARNSASFSSSFLTRT